MNRAEKIAGIVAITEMFKQYGLPAKVSPLIAILLGAVLSYAEDPTTQSILDGIILGAVATGGYAVIKNSAKGVIPSRSKTSPVEALEHDDYRGV